MTLEWIADPVSDDAPCGEDLFENDDAAYAEYYFDAVDRLPEADDYVRLGMETGPGSRTPDTIFDPNSVDLKSELGTIDALLQRSRDVRLLTLRAQWCALAANPDGFLETLGAMADLLEARVEEAHPSLADGPRDRLDALNDLNAMGAVIQPLRYLDLGNTGSSLRRIRVARGELTPHDGEDDLLADTLVSALSKGGEEVEQVHQQLLDIKAVLRRIATACLDCDKPHTPQFGVLETELDAIIALLGEANPDLTAAAESDVEEGDATASDAPAASGAPGETVFVKPATEVLDHEDARLRLVGVETYFGRHEPSSAAVLLVTQARLLIGKSLVEAFDALMPDAAPRSKVTFVGDMGFQLSHATLTRLAGEIQVETYPDDDTVAPVEAPAEPEPEPVAEDAPADDPVETQEMPAEEGSEGTESEDAETSEPAKRSLDDVLAEIEAAQAEEAKKAPVKDTPSKVQSQESRPNFYKVANAAEASAQVLAVESFFRAVEKSSPIPILLARARSYIGKDFESLMKEIVPVIDY